MSSASSLTEAVQQVAAQTTSLTDAVKEAARSGSDSTVIEFPRAVPDRPPGAAQVVRLVAAAPPAAGPFRRAPADASSESGPTGSAGLEASPQEPVDEPRETAGAELREVPRTRTRTVRPLATTHRPRLLARAARAPARRLRALVGEALSRCRAALRRVTRAVTRAGLRLAAVLLLCFLTLAVTPARVGSDRPSAAALQKRVALVVGNSAYRFTRRLDNPTNDATDVGAALRRLGFHVIEGVDLDKTSLDAKIREFSAALRGADVAAFFYAGHGFNMGGQNYLVPVDAQLSAAWALDYELVRLDLIRRTMEQEAKTSLLFFDACRDSPLSDNLTRAMGTRSVEVGRGLAVVQGAAGTLISFSTQPGTVALDGKGRNSPYSAALVRQLATSHEDIGTMLIAIRNDVMKETDRKQVPWEHSALTGRFFFNPVADAPRLQPVADARAREASEAWSAAKETRSLAVLDAFVSRYGDTFYAELARARMAELRKAAPWPDK
jgi:uncharacterized caspase-like protein